MLSLPKCPSCETRKVKRVRDDWFRCTVCGSVWESKGFTEKERLARFCPVCDTYVEYDNWQTFLEGYHDVLFGKEYSVSISKLRNFHYECHVKHKADNAKRRAETEMEIKRAELISQIECPKCKGQIYIEPEGYNDVIYICSQCQTVYPEEWINAELAEIRRAQAFEIVKRHYEPYVTRGDSIEYTRTTMMGVATNQFYMAQGGYFKQEKMKPNEIVIHFPDDSYYIFKLEDVYKSIKEVMLIQEHN